MNVSNVSSAPSYQPPVPINTQPKPRTDNDGDVDDRAAAVASVPAQSEATESAKLNVVA